MHYREVAVLRNCERDPVIGDNRYSADLMAAGWLLIVMREGPWYSVEYTGTIEQTDNLSCDLAAPNLSTHEMRSLFETRRVNSRPTSSRRREWPSLGSRS